MSPPQQDQFVDDDEEECCPLCVEEFDLSDRSFRPCPCGYQICQFCFNNIKQNMNGLCPACRRAYDDSTIEFKTITPEEMQKHKQQIAHKAKKNAQMRQKEAQKAEADTLSRKHLAGLRVVQKNLVYVTGLTPTIREDRLLDTLRGPEYFGQYGKIIKIVVSKAKENAHHQQSVGVYVTFARKEDAETCIKAVDGSQNGDRNLRAQYGTTKYCSAYLRGEHCNNRNCMFLHEPGEDNDSFTRQDLSMMNSIQTQQPAQSSTSRSAPPAHQGPAVAAATNMQDNSEAPSPTASGNDAPGLPATANWGSKAVQERRASRSTSTSNPSPMTTNAVPVEQPKITRLEDVSSRRKGKQKETSAQPSKSTTPQPAQASKPTRPAKPQVPGLEGLLKIITSSDFKFQFNDASLSEEERKTLSEYPSLIDPNGGAKRRARIEKEKDLTSQREAETQTASQPQQPPVSEREETNEATAGGSLQLGGEPEESHEPGAVHPNQHAIAPPGQQGLGGNLFGSNANLDDFSNLGLNGRNLSAQQQQQLLLSNLKSGPQSAGLVSNFQNNQAPQNHGQGGSASGHARQTSRFSFANDSASASANVQPVANQKLMNQQSNMMPKSANHYNQMSQHQALGGQFYTSGVQGPPPGLKATGTPPVSGTGMFGQGHGFATGGLGYGANAAGRNNNEAMYQDLLRSRNMDGGARVADAGKRGGVDVQDPSILQARMHQGAGMPGQGMYGQGQDDQLLSVEQEASINVDALVNDNDFDSVSGVGPVTSQLEQPRRSTPTVPPGFSDPRISNPKPGSQDQPKPPLWRHVSSSITPAVPVVPTTPVRAATPTKAKKPKQQVDTPESPGAKAKENVAPTKPETPARSSRKASKPPTVSESPRAKPEQAIIADQEKKAVAESTGKKSQKNKTTSKRGQSAKESSPEKESRETSGSAATSTPAKRQHPGKLDITAATTTGENDQSIGSNLPKSDAQTKSQRAASLTSTPSVPASPAASTGSPMKRSTAPRTLRVVPTPKGEHPPPLSAASAASLPQIPNVDKLRSRQASVASLNQPGTPASELVSDTASITSASVSRPSSPPLVGGKVGTAPVRKKTKSQAKKDRQERKRQIEEEQAMTLDEHKSDIEPVQAPIQARKKKTKKPPSSSKIPAPPKNQQPSPKPAKVEEDKEEEQKEAPKPTPRKASVSKTAPTTKAPKSTAGADTNTSETREKQESTAQAIIADLQKTGELITSTLEFFKPLSSSLAHASRSAQGNNTAAPTDLKIHFSEADLDALSKKKPVRLHGHDGKADSRTLITPQGKFFWGLTQELEEKALELEKHIEELKGQARFRPRKQAPHSSHSADAHAQSHDVLPAIATALKEAGHKLSKSTGSGASHEMPKLDPTATLLGSPSLPLPPVQAPDDDSHQNSQASAVTALQQQQQAQQQTPSDAGKYLNEFVLPKTDNPSPTQPRSEMAAVGGSPGAGTSNMSLNVGRIAKAAKVVAEGGTLSNTEIDGMGIMAADLLGGVVVQGLEALVGAGLGFRSQDFGTDGQGNITLAQNTLDVQGLMSAIDNGGGLAGLAGSAGQGARRGRGSLLSVEEAEQTMLAAKKDHDALEKKLAALIKRNKKLVSGATGKA